MKRLIIVFILVSAIIGLSTTSTMAQTGQRFIDFGVSLSCGSITVSVTSDYDTATKTQVLVGTSLANLSILNTLGDYVRVGANSSGSRTYFFLVQEADTNLAYSVRAYDEELHILVAQEDGIRDCDGEQQPAETTTTTTNTTTTATTSATASFLAACDSAGGITVQPVGGISFSVSGTQIAQGTAMALANNQNLQITTQNGISVVGTPNNAVVLTASDGYSLTIPATSCARNVTVVTGNVSAAAQASALSCSSTPADASSVHVVSAGENLFRIGLRYGVHFTTLAAYNGIPDPTIIFIGQCIAIPSSA